MRHSIYISIRYSTHNPQFNHLKRTEISGARVAKLYTYMNDKKECKKYIPNLKLYVLQGGVCTMY